MNFHFSFHDGESGTSMVSLFQEQYLKYLFDPRNLSIPPFLKVTTPPIPILKFESIIFFASSKLPVKQWRIPLSLSDLFLIRIS